MAEIFRRVEKKYILTKEQYNKILKLSNKYLVQDEYGKSTICNIYFDTNDYQLIRHSITKPFFKDKVRVRSYNVPNKNSKVFLEIKRKVDSVVGKRRIEMQLSDFYKYEIDSNSVENQNLQIKTELDYYFKMYNLTKKMFISYEREAFYGKDDRDFRITFDCNIIARNYDLELDKGIYGENILSENTYIMEVKTLGSMPLWFVKILNECKVIPGSFSKYGTAYIQLVLNRKPNNTQEVLDRIIEKENMHSKLEKQIKEGLKFETNSLKECTA